jgi:hypothetical protein
MAYDAFISYASEDRKEVARPLVEKLTEYGLKIWYDKFELQIGDFIRERIDEGLSSSRYGIIILSHNYFNKPWPKMELEGLIGKEVSGAARILPIWHNITYDEVLKQSPILAAKFAINTKGGIDSLVKEVLVRITQNKLTAKQEEILPITIAFKKLSTAGKLHRYSLIFLFELKSPPSRTGFRLNLLWPKFIRIIKAKNIIERKLIEIDSAVKYTVKYIDYVIERDDKIFPGETLEIVGPSGIASLEYEFDDHIYDIVEHNDINLYWKLFVHDQMPDEGIKNFKELNFF